MTELTHFFVFGKKWISQKKHISKIGRMLMRVRSKYAFWMRVWLICTALNFIPIFIQSVESFWMATLVNKPLRLLWKFQSDIENWLFEPARPASCIDHVHYKRNKYHDACRWWKEFVTEKHWNIIEEFVLGNVTSIRHTHISISLSNKDRKVRRKTFIIQRVRQLSQSIVIDLASPIIPPKIHTVSARKLKFLSDWYRADKTLHFLFLSRRFRSS